MNDDYMSEADNEVDGGYFADLEYAYQQKEIRRQEDQENKARKEENRKQHLLEQNKCIANLKSKLKRKNQQIDKLKQQLEESFTEEDVEEPCLIRNYKDLIEQFKQSQTQLAIQELEKVKIELKHKHYLFVNGYIRYLIPYRDICDQINSKIKELKGE